MHKREYEITKAEMAVQTETGAKILQVSALVTDHLGVKHDEHGKEIPRLKIITVGIAIPVKDLPSRNQKGYVMNKLKLAYKMALQSQSQAKTYESYKVTETVS